MRCCSRCQKPVPVDDFGWKNRAEGTRHSACKPCLAADRRRRYAADPERFREQVYRWNRANRDRVNGHIRAYRHRSPTFQARQRQMWNAWAREHRSQLQEAQQRRRAAARGSQVEPVDRAAIIARDDGTCYLCGSRPKGRDLTLDHVIPLMLGGPHAAWNLRVACRRCNSRKGRRLSA